MRNKTDPPIPKHEILDVAGVRNARGIAGLRVVDGGEIRPGALLRSATLQYLEPAGAEALSDYGVSLVIDLRSDQEREDWPSKWSPTNGRTIIVPLKPEADPTAGHGKHLAQVYRGIIDQFGDRLVLILREIADNDGATLVHCAAGKDRTGVVVALLLALLDVRSDDILANYEISRELLGEDFLAYLGASPEAQTRGMARGSLDSSPQLMAETFDYIQAQHGTVMAYLSKHGLTEVEVTRLRGKFLT